MYPFRCVDSSAPRILTLPLSPTLPLTNQVRGLLGAMYERRELLLGLLVLGCLLCWQG